jgi:serine/threonine protein kinase
MFKATKKIYGKGGYGCIAEITDSQNNIFALKSAFVDLNIDYYYNIRELDVLNRLNSHPHIVNLKYICFENPLSNPSELPTAKKYKNDYLYLILEPCKYNLLTLISNGTTKYEEFKTVILHILLGLEYIHSKNIIHQDIKPDNILISESGMAKICDFGMSEFYSLQGNTRDVYTHWYRAPEITKFEPHSYNSDIWAVFLIIYEIIFKTPVLYKCTNNNSTILSTIINKIPSLDRDLFLKKTDVSKLKLEPNVLSECTDTVQRYRKMWELPDKLISEFNSTPGSYDELINLTSQMSLYDCSKRYNSTDCLEHPFFNSKREYIKSIREKFKYILNRNNINLRNYIINVRNDSNRKTICNIIFTFFNNRENLDWYSHKIMFHSLSLWDLYYNSDNQIIGNTTHTLGECVYVYYIVLYLCIKYFSIFPIRIDFNKLTHNAYSNRNNLDFERRFIRDFLQCKFYRNTIYECSPETLDETSVCKLLQLYGELSDCVNYSVVQLSSELFLKIKK